MEDQKKPEDQRERPTSPYTPEQLREKAGLTEADMKEFMLAWASTRVDMLMGNQPNIPACKVIVSLYEKIAPFITTPPEMAGMLDRIKQRVAEQEH